MSDKTAQLRVFTGDRQIDEAQKNGQEAVRRLNALLFDGGVLLDAETGAPSGSGLTFVAGTARTLAHKLGRKARGFIEVYSSDSPSTGVVGLYATANPSSVTSETHITVTPFQSGVCQVFVF